MDSVMAPTMPFGNSQHIKNLAGIDTLWHIPGGKQQKLASKNRENAYDNRKSHGR